MKKIVRFEDLCCAHCAAKIEAEVQKIEGVTFASLNFLTQKMTLQTTEELMPSVLEEVVRITKKIEPDCQVTF